MCFSIDGSSITSNSELCVLAGERLISSINTILLKMGPGLNSNAELRGSNTDVPNTSLGIRSGVNCILEKGMSRHLASSLAVNVFATPGTPSMRIWPLLSNPAIIRSTIWC
jgi:hypothetical protein